MSSIKMFPDAPRHYLRDTATYNDVFDWADNSDEGYLCLADAALDRCVHVGTPLRNSPEIDALPDPTTLVLKRTAPKGHIIRVYLSERDVYTIVSSIYPY